MRQRLRLDRVGEFQWWKSRCAKKRVHQRTILGAQARYFFFEPLDVVRSPELFQLFNHEFAHTTARKAESSDKRVGNKGRCRRYSGVTPGRRCADSSGKR